MGPMAKTADDGEEDDTGGEFAGAPLRRKALRKMRQRSRRERRTGRGFASGPRLVRPVMRHERGRDSSPAMRAPVRVLGAGFVADDAEEDLLEREGLAAAAVCVAGLDAGAQLFEGAVGDEVAAVDDGDVSAEALDDFQDVGGEEDRCAAGDHALEHRLESAGGDGVDPFEWLVEEENFGAVDDGSGECELFLHAVGEVGDEFFCFVGESHELEELGGAGGGGRRRGRTCGRRSGDIRLR